MDGRLSILGLYQYNPNIFDDMELPSTDFSQPYEDLYIEPLPLDRETVIFSIITELSQFSVIYPNSEIMQKAIKVWSIRNLWKWQKYYESFFYKYNPIWNKDGHKVDSETRTGSTSTKETNKRTLNDKSTLTHGHVVTDSHNTTDTTTFNSNDKTIYNSEQVIDSVTDNTNTRSVNAFNGGETMAEKIVDSGTPSQTTTNSGDDDLQHRGNDSLKRTGSDTETHSGSDVTQNSGTITDEFTRNVSEPGTVTKFDSYEYGNIGVTMTQQMIEADRELYRNSIYDMIVRDFKNEFCIMIY